MYTALGVFLRAMLLSQMYVNDDFMHPCFHHRFTSESSIHTEQTLKFSLWATSVCVSFVCLIDEVGHAKPSKCTHFVTLLCRNPEKNKTTMTSSDRKWKTSRCASDSRCMWLQAWLSVCHSQHSLNIPPANTAEGRFLRVSIISICSNMSLAQPNRRWCQTCHACSNSEHVIVHFKGIVYPKWEFVENVLTNVFTLRPSKMKMSVS